MFNILVFVGEGMFVLCFNEMVIEKDIKEVLNIFNIFG